MSGRRLDWPPDLLAERDPSRLGAWGYALALVLLAFWDLGGRSILHRDVARFAVIATEMIRSGDWLVPTQFGEPYANKPILYIWAVAAPSALAGGVTPFLLRLPSALALVGLALATSAWGRARTGSIALGRLAGLLVATTWFVYELGRSGRPDLLATAFATAAAMWTDRAILGKGGPRDPWWAALALAGGLLSKGPVVLLPTLFLVLVPRAGVPRREVFRRARPLLLLAGAVVGAALWVVPAVLRGGPEFARRLLVDQTAERLTGQANHLEPWWDYFVTFPKGALPWSPLFLAALVLLATRWGRRLLGDRAHVHAALGTLAVLSVFPTKDTRYAAILVPPLAIGATQLLSAFADRLRDATHLRRLLGALAVLLAGAAAVSFWLTVTTRAPVAWIAPFLLLAAVRLLARGRRAAMEPRAAFGTVIGIAVLLFASGLLIYWSVLPSHGPIEAVRENRAIAAVLPAGAPVVLLGEPRDLDTEDVFEAAPNARYAADPAAIPSRDAAKDLVVVCLASRVDAVAQARGETPVRLLERPRRGDPKRTLVVLRFGGPSGAPRNG